MSGSIFKVGDRIEWWFGRKGGPCFRGAITRVNEQESPWGPVYFYDFQDDVTGKITDGMEESLQFRPLCLLDELAEVLGDTGKNGT